jgi:hypothetical protein
MTEARRYDTAIQVNFGGQVIEAAPLKGLAKIRAFEAALVEEIYSLQRRVEGHIREGKSVSPEALLETGVDQARLLKLGVPELTEAMLDESTAGERVGLLVDVCYLNNLGRFTPFLAPEMLMELGAKINRAVPGFPIPELNGSSSEPVSLGATSSEN